MKTMNVVIIAIVVGLVCFGIGYSLTPKTLEEGGEETVMKGNENTETALANLLTSKVVDLSSTVSGEVTEISGRSLTVQNNEDTLTLSIKEDASIYRMVPPEEEATIVPQPMTKEEVEFGAIEKGDRVNIFAELKADATLEGVEVVIYP